MTKTEIIEETKNFYKKENRGFDSSIPSCEYKTPDNCRCAVGRCIKDDEIDEVQMNMNGSALVPDLFNIYIKDKFKDEYQGHGYQFWCDLQEFHDQAVNWNTDGVSDQGMIVYNKLLEKYKQ